MLDGTSAPTAGEYAATRSEVGSAGSNVLGAKVIAVD